MGIFKRLKEKWFGRKDKSVEELTELNEQKEVKKLLKSKDMEKYETGLSKSSSFGKKLLELQNKYTKIDEDYFDELEEILIMSDINTELVFKIIEKIKKEVKTNNIDDPKLIGEIVADQMFLIYTNKTIVNTTLDIKNDRLNVIVMVGVNGSGKTTSIAKLAYKYKQLGKKVIIAAADTFRAGAVNQLDVWAQRIGVDIVKPDKEGQDPSSVVYKSLDVATKNDYDLLIIDTAGRLQNKINLMKELEKMFSVIRKFVESAPHEALLVLDGTTGQNGLSQARVFKEVCELSGIILTKMDGTSKGGIVLSIKDEFDLNVKFLGLGEKLDDLKEFDLDMFIYQMTKDLIEADGK
ncbi:signal recognition particle-docking protein FtsY [Mycoplasmopsis alligatoris]|uniref:Signal recognition particle receptor FtsY n=1 Tax=Mycoplasmopsis alligatoris A21JP2 TaxID=747682 RepID=D4XVD4_9BACT|nr:signal recognition particle-docking protein FtsY [Mycoplasmopsis alligatoris]EFF41669.1 signal recognition particle-docking protein FtsY [Mycoplasmopsis alligatoris A21JP2]